MIIPFGRYAGRHVHECPVPYLRWLSENCRHLRWELRNEVESILRSERRTPPPSPSARPRPPVRQTTPAARQAGPSQRATTTVVADTEQPPPHPAEMGASALPLRGTGLEGTEGHPTFNQGLSPLPAGESSVSALSVATGVAAMP